MILKRLIVAVLPFFFTFFAYGQEHPVKTSGNKRLTVQKLDNAVTVEFCNDDNNMEISFFPCGVNRLTAIGKVSYFSGPDRRDAEEFESCTDWIGPYFTCSVASVGKGLHQKFTGGWHGSNGDGTGNATASTQKVKISADGKELKKNKKRDCSRVDLFVTNLIRGYDFQVTGKNLLEETVHYCITTDRKIQVEVKIMAVEDAVIQRYYGLQSQNFPIFDRVSYYAGDQLLNAASTKENSDCGLHQHADRIVLSGSRTKHRIELMIDTSAGLGTFSNLGKDKPQAFSANYGKSYFNLINNDDLFLKKGNTVFWRGTYVYTDI